jgi:hypothetical protein
MARAELNGMVISNGEFSKNVSLMIKHELSELPPEKIRKIREWLDREECDWLKSCVASEIAVIQADATNLALGSPGQTIGEPNALPPASVTKIKEAAILQSFLDILAEMRKPETKFQTVRLTI